MVMFVWVREPRVGLFRFCYELHVTRRPLSSTAVNWSPKDGLSPGGVIRLWEMQKQPVYLMMGTMKTVVGSRQPYHSSLSTCGMWQAVGPIGEVTLNASFNLCFQMSLRTRPSPCLQGIFFLPLELTIHCLCEHSCLIALCRHVQISFQI